ncbi:MAG: hypothetical protein IJO08_04650 [Clostridia bacterium]|nr:hypothetical protein [Clostridia bacterium]
MANNRLHRFSQGNGRFITFDSEGFVVEAKGFSGLLWASSPNVDSELIGKHIDEVAKILEENGVIPYVYLWFETYVHLELLKEILRDVKEKKRK